MAYLLDANVFIEAKNRYYGFDFCPAFWEWLIVQNDAGQVFSIKEVGDEIGEGNDDLSKWARARGADFFLRYESDMSAFEDEVSTWIEGEGYEPAAIDNFLQEADYDLIAQALARTGTVVTHERKVNSRKKIKIPNVCTGLGIQCMTPFEMLRRERARFVLGSAE